MPASAGEGAEPAQHAALDCRRCAGQRLHRRSRQPPHRRPEQRHDVQDACTPTSATRGRSASRPGRISTCTPRTRIPTATRRHPRGTSPARSTRWSSTARSSASSAKPAKGLGEFSTVHEIDCRNPDQLFVSEISAWRAQKIILSPSKMQPATSSAAAR